MTDSEDDDDDGGNAAPNLQPPPPDIALTYSRNYCAPPSLMGDIDSQPVTKSEGQENFEQALELLDTFEVAIAATAASKYLRSPIGDVIAELSGLGGVAKALSYVGVDLFVLAVTEPVRFGVYLSEELRQDMLAHAGEAPTLLGAATTLPSAFARAVVDEGRSLLNTIPDQLNRLAHQPDRWRNWSYDLQIGTKERNGK